MIVGAGSSRWSRYKTSIRWFLMVQEDGHWFRTGICWCRKVVAGSRLVVAGAELVAADIC